MARWPVTAHALNMLTARSLARLESLYRRWRFDFDGDIGWHEVTWVERWVRGCVGECVSEEMESDARGKASPSHWISAPSCIEGWDFDAAHRHLSMSLPGHMESDDCEQPARSGPAFE